MDYPILATLSILLSFLLSFCGSQVAWASHTANLVKGNLGNEVLYYISVDHFFDGVSTNNIPNYAFPLDPELGNEKIAYNQSNRLILPYIYDPTHRYIKLHWGGDLEGVIQKLDYLQSLGVSQIVLSNILDSANGLIYSPNDGLTYLHDEVRLENETFDPFYAYSMAGFGEAWITDWFEIDEHFRDPKDETYDRFRVFKRLLDEAGNRGIGIILELNLNHTSPSRNSSDYGPFDPRQYESWFVDNGAVYRHREKVADYWNPLTNQINPDGWFHEPIPLDYDRPNPEMLENGFIGGYPDLNHENPDVADYLIDAAKFWLTLNRGGHQIAGFYFPSIPNINVSFWQRLENEILAINPDAILIANYENSGYRYRPGIDWYENTDDYAMVNYDFSIAARRFFGRDRGWDGRTIVLRENLLMKEGQYYNYSLPQRMIHYIFNPSQSLEIPRHSLDVVEDADAKGWVTFIDSADWPRILTYYPNMSEQAYASMIKFMLSSSGVPMIMYGVETGLALPYHIEHQNLFGMGGKPFNQQMMIWPEDQGWNQKLYEVTQKMGNLRQDYPVLRYGKTEFLFPQESKPDKDIFMLREFPACEAAQAVVQDLEQDEQEDCARILYAYSTEGGNFLVALEGPGIATIKDVESASVTRPSDTSGNLIPIHLDPEASKVLVLQ